MLGENSTTDEPIHLVCGYSYLRQKAFGLNAEHPPLGKMLCALPLLFLKPQLPPGFREAETEEGELGRQFLYHNQIPAALMLNMARGVTIVLSLVLGLTIALFTKKRFGLEAALLALALYCFDPNFIAHGHYVTTDLIATLCFFVVSIAWLSYLERPDRRTLIITGFCSGFAAISKFSLLLLPLVLLLMYAGKRWTNGTTISLSGLFKAIAVVAAITGVVIYSAYGFETTLPISDKWVATYFDKTSDQLRADPTVPSTVVPLIDPSTPLGKASHWFVRKVPIPAFSFFKGIYRFYNHSYWGHDAYLLGSHSKKGWWYYFVVAIAVKTPAVTLALLLISIAVLIWRRGDISAWPRLPVLLIPPAVYFVTTLATPINIGVRHVLPIYPFLFVIIGAVVIQFPIARIPAGGLVLLLMIESFSSYPNYLAFFNFAAGGSQNGPNYLIDSNIDWGQDLKKLKQYLDRNSIREVCLRYFGSAEPGYFGIAHRDLAMYPAPATCSVAAASVNELYFKDSRIKRLLTCEPRARIGYSIYVYDLRDGECAEKSP